MDEFQVFLGAFGKWMATESAGERQACVKRHLCYMHYIGYVEGGGTLFEDMHSPRQSHIDDGLSVAEHPVGVGVLSPGVTVMSVQAEIVVL